MKLTRKLASMALVILPGVLFGRCPENYWQPVGGDWNGSWSDERHWSLGHEPTASERAYFPAVDQSFSVSIEGTHDVGELDLQGMDGDFRDLTFSGSGTVRVTKSDSAGCSSWFGTRRNLVLDGASLVWTAEADLMLSGHLEVRSGSSIVHKRIWQMRTVQAQIVVNGGTVSWNGALRYYETSTDSYLVVNSGTVYLAALSGADDANKSAYPFVMEVNGGEVTAGDFSLTRQNCALKVNGGKMTVNSTFKMNAGSGLYMTGGELDIKASESNVQVAQGVTISLFGGTIGFHYHFGDRRFLSNEGATVNLNGYRLLPDGVEPLKGETVKMGRIFNASPGAHLDYRRLVFQKKEEPFGVRDGTERYFYLQGPTTISAEDSMPSTCGMAWYAFCRGAFVIDTRDADDGETPLNINLLNVHPEYGECSFDILGGGTLFFRQAFSGDTFKSFAVRQNTTLQLADRKMDSTDYCALLTERLVLEKNATLKLNAKYNHVVAGEFDIDPGAKIEITVPDDLTVGAFAVLQNAGSIDSVPPIDLSQILLIQSEGRGFKLNAENGQVTVYHEGSEGEYPTEWTGLGPNDNINEAANFKTQAPASRETVYFGAGSARLNPKWSYPLRDGGYVIGTMIFLETAVETFDYHASGETLAEERSFVSHSGVPQRHTGAKRTPAIVVQTDGSGPLVFDGEAQWGGNYHAGDTPDDPNHFRWTTAGDCRIAIPAFTMYDFALNPMLTGVTPFSRFTVLPGSSVTVTRMADDISASRAKDIVIVGGKRCVCLRAGQQQSVARSAV